MNPAKKHERVPFAASLHWRYLHKDKMKTWKEIASMKDYKKVLQSYYLQLYETKNRRPCYRQKKAQQRSTSKVITAEQMQYYATS